MPPTHTTTFREGCLKNHVALVTGGGSGICKGIVRKFMQAGCNVAILSRSMKKLRETATELMCEAPGVRCFPVSADVRDQTAMVEAIDQILFEFGRIDILVNGAAGNFLCPPEKLSLNAFKSVMEIDAYGTFITSQLVHNRAFIKQAPLEDAYPSYQRGIIINISMTLHYAGTLMQTHAGAAKAAIDAMTQHLAVEWGPEGIRVVGVAPGPIEGTVGLERLHDFSRGSATVQPQRQENEVSEFGELIPLQRLGTTDDVANLCLFLCLPEASYITGTTIVVDGGQRLTSGNYALFIPLLRKIWAQKGVQLPQKSGDKIIHRSNL